VRTTRMTLLNLAGPMARTRRTTAAAAAAVMAAETPSGGGGGGVAAKSPLPQRRPPARKLRPRLPPCERRPAGLMPAARRSC
jgi:hypothetical protein